PLPQVTIHANTRRLSEGFFRSIGLEHHTGVLRSLDKLPRLGPERGRALLLGATGASPQQAQACLDFAGIRTRAASFGGRAREPGTGEVTAVLQRVGAAARGVTCAALSIARGLDYYTGTVFESFLEGQESLGSICSGGRYDSLAADNRHSYPGVGLSIGLTR